MIIGMTDDGDYIEAASGDPEVRLRDLLRVCPDIRLDLLKRGHLEPDPEKRKKAIAEAEKEIRAKKLKQLKARLAEI